MAQALYTTYVSITCRAEALWSFSCPGSANTHQQGLATPTERMRASMRATGVRLMRSVTSPMAQMLGHVVRENSSTFTAFDFSSISTPACDSMHAVVKPNSTSS